MFGEPLSRTHQKASQSQINVSPIECVDQLVKVPVHKQHRVPVVTVVHKIVDALQIEMLASDDSVNPVLMMKIQKGRDSLNPASDSLNPKTDLTEYGALFH